MRGANQQELKVVVLDVVGSHKNLGSQKNAQERGEEQSLLPGGFSIIVLSFCCAAKSRREWSAGDQHWSSMFW